MVMKHYYINENERIKFIKSIFGKDSYEYRYQIKGKIFWKTIAVTFHRTNRDFNEMLEWLTMRANKYKSKYWSAFYGEVN